MYLQSVKCDVKWQYTWGLWAKSICSTLPCHLLCHRFGWILGMYRRWLTFVELCWQNDSLDNKHDQSRTDSLLLCMEKRKLRRIVKDKFERHVNIGSAYFVLCCHRALSSATQDDRPTDWAETDVEKQTIVKWTEALPVQLLVLMATLPYYLTNLSMVVARQWAWQLFGYSFWLRQPINPSSCAD